MIRPTQVSYYRNVVLHWVTLVPLWGALLALGLQGLLVAAEPARLTATFQVQVLDAAGHWHQIAAPVVSYRRGQTATLELTHVGQRMEIHLAPGNGPLTQRMHLRLTDVTGPQPVLLASPELLLVEGKEGTVEMNDGRAGSLRVEGRIVRQP